jgi:anaerobic magnesium-protoporphyrin IX monomethyl ester cyclase
MIPAFCIIFRSWSFLVGFALLLCYISSHTQRMKVLLIQPPIRDFYQTAIRTQPIGLAYLAAALKAHGQSVDILDCQTHQRTASRPPSELLFLESYYPRQDKSPFKLYSGYYHFGMNWDEISRRVEISQADVYGISSSFTPYHAEALEVARIIKQGDIRRTVVMGGAHVSCDPQGVMKSPFVDYVVLGEGEFRMPLLLEQIAQGGSERLAGLDGIGYRAEGQVLINPLTSFIKDLDELPFPCRELLDSDHYCIGRKRATMLITSRGCPHGCAYCSAHLVMGGVFRGRSPAAIVQEMLTCKKNHDIVAFDIEDDNFTFDKERAKKLFALILDTFGEGNLQLSAMNGISYAALDGELLGLMKRAGFKTINLSFVSADSATREILRRPGTASAFDRIVEEAGDIGLNTVAYAIFGMPGETIPDMIETLIHLMAQRVLLGPSVYYPTPGTSLFEICRNGRMLPPAVAQWRASAFPVETKDFERLDIVTLLRLSRMINFIKGKMDRGELPEGITWKGLRCVLTEQKMAGEGETCRASCNTYSAMTWCDLIILFINERAFFSLLKDQSGGISFDRLASSSKVLDYFFTQAGDTPIYKSRV